MNILNIIQCANLGGMERSNLLRLKGLQSRGHDVRLISLNRLGGLQPLLERANIPAIGLDYQNTSKLVSFLQMRRTFQSQPLDAVIMTGHNWPAALALRGVSAQRRILCIHYHHFENGYAARHWPLFYRMATQQFDAITFCSRFIHDEALQLHPDLARKSLVVHNPFELPKPSVNATKLAARQRLGLPLDAPVVGNAGGLVPRKRFDVFLDVAKRVHEALPDTFFLIAGDGPERPALEARAHVHGLFERVRFLGWQAEMEPILSALDVLLFNSDHDALGRTPIEAAAHGVPVVASVVSGGLREFLGEASGACVLDEHNVEALAEQVVQLLTVPGRTEEMGSRCRAHVRELCSVEHHTDQIEQLLKR